jgi:hypothetical protein
MTESDDVRLAFEGSDDAPTEWTGTEEQFAKALEFMENQVSRANGPPCSAATCATTTAEMPLK